MALTDVHHVVIRVEDFDSSVKNWESILGYSVSRIDQNQDLGIQQAFLICRAAALLKLCRRLILKEPLARPFQAGVRGFTPCL